MPDYVEIRKYSGMSTFFSKEDRPVEVLQEARNLRFNHTLGRLVKRGGYTNKLTAGLTSLKNMIEFKNKNSEQILVIMDGNTIEESVYSGGSYGAISAITADAEISTQTFDGDNFHPIIVNKEMRSGGGVGANTQFPVWYGYIPARGRFNDDYTLTAGRYLCAQYALSGYTGLASSGESGRTSNGTGHVSGEGLAAGTYKVYLAPILDGYQRGFPEQHGFEIVTAADGFVVFSLSTNGVTDNHNPRLTGYDVFVSTGETYEITKGVDTVLAYYLETIDLNRDSDYFLQITGDVNNTTATKIVINNYANFLTFDPTNMFIYNVGGNEEYRVTAVATDTPTPGQVELTVTPNPVDSNASRTLKFFSRWYGSTGNYFYFSFYDNYYKKTGSEMYLYLNIPAGDTGIFDPDTTFYDVYYKYSANNGVHSLYGGMANYYLDSEGDNYTYFSVAGSPDIIPAQNIFRHKASVRGMVSIGKDFLVFTDLGVERITILDNGVTDQNDEYLDAVLVDHKAIAKINDNEIAFMSYKGAYIISDRRVIFVGKHLNEWFIGSSAKLSQTQKEACVAHYNDENNEVWFSFPTYTTTPYTAGVTMVFDIDAYRGEDLSAWWFVQSDIALLAFTTNSEQKMLAGAATSIVDMDAYGTDESVSTAHKLKLLQNAIPNRLVRWGWLHVNSSTSDTVSVNLYFDGSASAVALTLNTDYRGLIAYLKKTLEVEITTAASTNTVEHLGTVLEFQPKRVA